MFFLLGRTLERCGGLCHVFTGTAPVSCSTYQRWLLCAAVALLICLQVTKTLLGGVPVVWH